MDGSVVNGTTVSVSIGQLNKAVSPVLAYIRILSIWMEGADVSFCMRWFSRDFRRVFYCVLGNAEPIPDTSRSWKNAQFDEFVTFIQWWLSNNYILIFVICLSSTERWVLFLLHDLHVSFASLWTRILILCNKYYYIYTPLNTSINIIDGT